MAGISVVRVQSEVFCTEVESARLTAGRTDIGAVVTFTGHCRDEGGTLAALEIEHYPGMAEAEIARVVAQASARWPLEGVVVVHRHGRIEVGEPIVLVAVASQHRGPSFEAAAFLMDYLKTSAPFWKKQYLASALPGPDVGGWVGAKAEDAAAAAKWRT